MVGQKYSDSVGQLALRNHWNLPSAEKRIGFCERGKGERESERESLLIPEKPFRFFLSMEKMGKWMRLRNPHGI